MRPGDDRWPGRRPPRGWAEPAAATSAISWLGRVRLWQRLQFGELQVGGGLLFFSQVRGDFFFFFFAPLSPPLFQALAFRVGSLVRSEKCLQRRGVPQVGLLRAFLSPPPPPPLFLPAFPPLWPHPGRFSPPSHVPLGSRLHLGEKKAALFPVSRPQGSAAPPRALPAPAVLRRPRSAPVPSSPSPFPPSSGGRSRTWAPCGAPPPPRRRPRFPPGPGARSSPVLPLRFICCCCSPSLSLSSF